MKFKCYNCGHTLSRVWENGKPYFQHRNIGQGIAHICRVKRCNCLKPECKVEVPEEQK